MYPPNADPSALSSLQSVAANAIKAEERGGPGTVEPTAYGGQQGSLVTLPMTPDEVGLWWERIEKSKQRIRKFDAEWDALLDAYRPSPVKSGSEDIKVNAHFRNVHTKMGQLFPRSPEMQATPRGGGLDKIENPMVPGTFFLAEDVVTIKQEVLNYKLGRHGINGSRLMDELFFDEMAWAGIGCCKVGYCATTKPVQQPIPGAMPDPMTGQPPMQTINVPIHEEWYGRRFSPKKLLVNEELRSTRYDEDATYLGMEFFMAPAQAKKAFNLTDEELTGAGSEDDRVYKGRESENTQSKTRGLIHGYELWVKACYFTDQPHPLAINQLVMIDGIKDRPVVWRPSPDQSFDQMGRLTPDSMIGFPILVLCLRDFADSPFPPADAAFTNPQVKGMNTHRRQSLKMRDAAIGKYIFEGGGFEDPEKEQLKNGEVGEWIEVADGFLQAGLDKKIASTSNILKMSQDDYRTAAQLKQDMDETLGIGSTQAGTPEETVRTATEIAAVATATAGRAKKEQNRAVEFWIALASKIDALLMRYATEDDYIQIAGQDGTKRLQVWNNKVITGRYDYDIKPDSQNDVDARVDRQQKLNFYNLTAQDPLVNRAPIVRDLARAFGFDPAKVVLDPAAIMMQTQPPHGGAANKHIQEQSGGRQNEPGSNGQGRDTRNPSLAQPSSSPQGTQAVAGQPGIPGGPLHGPM